MYMRLPDVVATELAALQCGAFARWQLEARGVDDAAIRRRLANGYWSSHVAGVYGLPSHPPSFDQRLWIAWLAVGPAAVVSHESAAELHDLHAVARGLVTVTARHPTHHRIPGAFVHQINDVLPEHRTSVRGLPTATVARTVVDLAGRVDRERLLHIAESAKHRRQTSYEEIGVVLMSVARRGKPGVGRLARVLDTLAAFGGLEQSVLERKLLLVLKQHRLPPPILQMPHPGRSLPASCVDAGYPEAKLIVEADGRFWHSRTSDITRDRERDAEAARAGWLTLRLLYEQINGDPAGSAATVRDILAIRLVQLAS
jgi:very-short-patch-repair endonuclease